ncbi:MAG: methyltransferase domain-containing protein [Bacteroidetes bacterium]|jgi:SAM-dependent methyltransferase|nr:methyltransferase domain-containing protein [Bacteroidota bacterium]
MQKHKHHDPLGQAIHDYFLSPREQTIYVHSKDVESYELPVSLLFRTIEDMPVLEQLALKACRGKVLDIGAGAGCHTQLLQQKGFSVDALDISDQACEVMRKRGIRVVHEADFFHFQPTANYHTLLLLMNGIGICGNPKGYRNFLQQAKKLLVPEGQIIFDTSDIIYLFQDECYNLNNDNYYGTISCQMKYNNLVSEWFDWLYLDRETLMEIANDTGYTVEILAEGEHYDYLVRLMLNHYL